jgi:hypothetical protein
MDWQPIETAPKPADWMKFRGLALVGCWSVPRDEEAGEPAGLGQWVWVQVATLTSNGWHVWSSGFKGLHGTCTFPLNGNATHWAPLPAPPADHVGARS